MCTDSLYGRTKCECSTSTSAPSPSTPPLQGHNTPASCRIIRRGLNSQEAELLLLILTTQKAASPNVAAASNCRHRAALLPVASFHLPSAPIYGHYHTAKNRRSALVSCIYLETLLLENPDTTQTLPLETSILSQHSGHSQVQLSVCRPLVKFSFSV